MEAGSWSADHRPGRSCVGMARAVHPRRLDPVWRVPVAERLGRTLLGFHAAPIGRYPGDAVYQWRAVIGPGHLVVSPLRRRVRGAVAVAVDRNWLRLPGCDRGGRRYW